MASEIKLKPCPFCGAKAELLSGYYNALESARVECTECNASIYMDSDDYPAMDVDSMEGSVIEQWNRRADA